MKKKTRFVGLLNTSHLTLTLDIQTAHLCHDLVIANSIRCVVDVIAEVLVCHSHQRQPQEIVCHTIELAD